MAKIGAVSVTTQLYRANRNGTLLEDLSELATIGSGKITHSIDAEPKLSLALDLPKKAGVRSFADWLVPILTCRWADGTVETGWMGQYVIVPGPLTHDSGSSRGSIEARDATYLLKLATYPRGKNFAAGLLYTDVITEVLESVGFTRIAIPPSDKVLPSRFNVKPGVSKLEVVNKLLEAIGYYSLSADLLGYLVSKPIPASLVNEEPAASYGPDDLTADPIREDPDMDRFCNVVVVRRIQSGKSTIYAVARNDNPASQSSTVALAGGPEAGFKVEYTRTIDDNDIINDDAAQAIADGYLAEGQSFYRRLTIKTYPTPDLGLHDVVSLNVSNPDGEISAGSWLRQGWEVGFSAASASVIHSLGRVEDFRNAA